MNDKPRDKEVWKPTTTNPNYLVSSHGRVKSLLSGKILKCSKNKAGYPQFGMAGRMVRVHREICLAFGIIETRDMVNHIDGVKHNNHISNLEKSNHAHNNAHARRLGLKIDYYGEENKTSKLKERQVKKMIRMYADGVAVKEIAKAFNLYPPSVCKLINGKSWSHLNSYRQKLGVTSRYAPRGFVSEEQKNEIRSKYKRESYHSSNARELAIEYGLELNTVTKIVREVSK